MLDIKYLESDTKTPILKMLITKCDIFTEITRYWVLALIFLDHVEGEALTTCGESSCSLKNHLEYETDFQCTVSGKSGHTAILMKFTSVKDPAVGEQYYLHHPVYRLFDFSYRRNRRRQQKRIELFFDCITGLDDRPDPFTQVSRRVYIVTFTAFTMQSSEPGVTVSYFLTSYNRKIHNERTWRPNIMTSVFGSYIYVVFERLPGSWVRSNTYYRVLLYAIEDNGTPIIANVNCLKMNEFTYSNTCKFKVKGKGRFFVKVLAYKCLWSRKSSPCTRGQSYSFSVNDDNGTTENPKHSFHSVATSVDGAIYTGQKDSNNPTVVPPFGKMMSFPGEVSNGTYYPVMERRKGRKGNPLPFVIFGIVVGILLVSVMFVCFWINGRGNRNKMRIELMCDHPEHKMNETALCDFFGKCLKFEVKNDEINNEEDTNSDDVILVKMICDEQKLLPARKIVTRRKTNLREKQKIVIFAQKPKKLPTELQRTAKTIFKWPDQLINLISYMSRYKHNTPCCQRNKNVTGKNYQNKTEYQLLLKAFKLAICDELLDKETSEQEGLLHNSVSPSSFSNPWEMRADSNCPIHGNSLKSNNCVANQNDFNNTKRDNLHTANHAISFLSYQDVSFTAKRLPKDILYPPEEETSYSSDSNTTDTNESKSRSNTKTAREMEFICDQMMKINFE